MVDEANAIGTTYLRAQTLAEPVRTRSLDLLRTYTDLAIRISHEVPGSAAIRRTTAAQAALQRRLWSLAGQALHDAPVASAPRLYVDSLNAMIDQQTVRISALNNRVPEHGPAAGGGRRGGRARAARALPLPPRPRARGVLLAAALVTMLLFVTFDLDRPTRGLVTVPDTPFTSLRASMALPPAAE